MNRAGVIRRATALAIDGVIALVCYVISIATAMAIFMDASPAQQSRAIYATFCALWLVYSLTEVFVGATLGKLALGIRIADAHGRKPHDGRLLLRWSTKYFWMLPIIFDAFVPGTAVSYVGSIAFLVVLLGLLGAFNEDRLTWHDQWSGTSVVRRASPI